MASPRPTIEIVASALVVYRGHVMLCNQVGKRRHFLPHMPVQFGQAVGSAASRAVKALVGIPAMSFTCVSIDEYAFRKDGRKRHCINFTQYVFLQTPTKRKIRLLPIGDDSPLPELQSRMGDTEVRWHRIRGIEDRTNLFPVTHYQLLRHDYDFSPGAMCVPLAMSSGIPQ